MRNRERRRCKLSGSRTPRHLPRKRSTLAARLWPETLETRSMLAVSALIALGGPRVEVEPNDTLDRAQDLGDLRRQTSTALVGTIGDGPAGAADVDWYRFTLDAPAHVSLGLRAGGSDRAFDGVLSLYNNDPFGFQDVYNPLGHRLLAQESGAGGVAARVERDLGPGTYELAVSGAGNREFHPFLAGSGYASATGDYLLDLAPSDLAFGPADGPAVLTAEPGPGSVLRGSPFVIRLNFGSALDPSTVIPGETVRLTSNPGGNFGDGDDRDVALSWVNAGVGGYELQLVPAAPLPPGWYQVFLAGDTTAGAAVLTDLAGNPLGTSVDNPRGHDYSESFRVGGVEGSTTTDTGAGDTAAGAHDLGDLTNSVKLVSITGAIGDDPHYDNSDVAHHPGNDVDLYHFRISGPGSYAFVAEVFAGRIGSPLDPGISLYRSDPADGSLHFLAGNNNTSNIVEATNFTNPLSFDSLLSRGLTAGDYYLAVAGGYNTPSPFENLPLDTPGLFDPNVSRSGQNGLTTGPYVLKLLVHPASEPPRVVSSSLTEGATLDRPPTSLTVDFSTPVNLQQLGYQAYLETSSYAIPGVYIEGGDGTKYYPRIESFDQATNRATFLMLDRLPGGSFTLRLSGPRGLADLGGNPLPGNDASGDHVVHFAVQADGNALSGSGSSALPIDARLDPDGIRHLGVLFPRELEAGVIVDHAPTNVAVIATQHRYMFTLIQDQAYGFGLQGADLPQDAFLSLSDGNGEVLEIGSRNAETTLFGSLTAGDYYVTVHGVTSDAAYRVRIEMTGNADNPVPLASSPAPSLQFRFNRISIAPPATPVEPTPTVVGNGGPGTVEPTPTVVGNGGPGMPVESTQTVVGNGGPAAISNASPAAIANGPGNASPAAIANDGPGAVSNANPAAIGPAPYDSLGSSGPGSGNGNGSGNGGGASVQPLVTLNLPAIDPTGAPSDPSGYPSTIVTSVATTAANPGRGVTAAPNAVATNLGPTDFAAPGIGPLGGVPQAADSTPSTQTVQVAIEVPVNAPVPTEMVSLVTLTRLGEVGDIDDRGPDDQDGEGAADVATAGAVPTVDIAPRTHELDGPVQRLGKAMMRLAMWLARTPVLPHEAAPDAATPEQVATANPASTPMGTGERGAVVEGAGAGEDVVLATADAPWVLILSAVTMAVVSLRRRLKARVATAWGHNDDARSTRSRFRFWSPPSTRRLPHGMRPLHMRHAAANRPDAYAQPRHLTNP